MIVQLNAHTLHNHPISVSPLDIIHMSIMLSQAPGLSCDKHTFYLTLGVHRQETDSEEDAHLLRPSVLCCHPACAHSVSKGRFAPLNTLAFK